MSQDTKPAPFNLGDHVRYVAEPRRAAPQGQEDEMNLVLAHGMVGVIILSTGDLSEEGESAPNPWHCAIQFDNGFQLDITPDNCADFEMARSPVAATA